MIHKVYIAAILDYFKLSHQPYFTSETLFVKTFYFDPLRLAVGHSTY